MKRFISTDKLSKKEQKKLNAEKRRDWNGASPVTRVVPDSKRAYKRNLKHRSRLFAE